MEYCEATKTMYEYVCLSHVLFFQIHIHDPNDIPYIQYVGKAAAVSHHTYFEMTKQDVSYVVVYGIK